MSFRDCNQEPQPQPQLLILSLGVPNSLAALFLEGPVAPPELLAALV